MSSATFSSLTRSELLRGNLAPGAVVPCDVFFDAQEATSGVLRESSRKRPRCTGHLLHASTVAWALGALFGLHGLGMSGILLLLPSPDCLPWLGLSLTRSVPTEIMLGREEAGPARPNDVL